jgi:hypothetical protein
MWTWQKFSNHNKKAFYASSAEKDALRVINMEEINKTLASALRTFTYLLVLLGS